MCLGTSTTTAVGAATVPLLGNTPRTPLSSKSLRTSSRRHLHLLWSREEHTLAHVTCCRAQAETKISLFITIAQPRAWHDRMWQLRVHVPPIAQSPSTYCWLIVAGASTTPSFPQSPEYGKRPFPPTITPCCLRPSDQTEALHDKRRSTR